MKYLGGKKRLAKHLAAIVNSHKPERYHEPFCGMFSVGLKVNALIRTGADSNHGIVDLLNKVRGGWLPPEVITEDLYMLLKKAPESPLRTAVGYGCSYGAKWFGGYARGTGRNYAMEARNAFVKMRPELQKCEFYHQKYQEYQGDADLLYCDPPYQGTTGWDFDHLAFWEWVRQQSAHRIVLVSELQAPDDFHTVWEQDIPYSLRHKTNNRRIEKLWRIN